MHMHYVAGFMFSSDKEKVALILKDHGPEVIVGKWNAIGGKIKDGERPSLAMIREFKEETGVSTTTTMWTHFVTLEIVGKRDVVDCRVMFFHAADDLSILSVRSVEKEKVHVFNVKYLSNAKYIGDDALVPNLQWILPMALAHINKTVSSYIVSEI